LRQPARAFGVLLLLALGCNSRTWSVRSGDCGPIPAAPRAAVASHQATWIYVVGRGDTLDKIARAYGADVDQIASLNRIAEPDRIEVGQRLRIPLEQQQVSAPPPAPKRTANGGNLRRDRQELELARKAVANADFPGAARRLQSLRTRLEGNRHAPTYLLLGLEETSAHVHVALGEQEQASAAFGRALELNPRYEPPASSPPKVMRAFEAARRAIASR